MGLWAKAWKSKQVKQEPRYKLYKYEGTAMWVKAITPSGNIFTQTNEYPIVIGFWLFTSQGTRAGGFGPLWRETSGAVPELSLARK